MRGLVFGCGSVLLLIACSGGPSSTPPTTSSPPTSGAAAGVDQSGEPANGPIPLPSTPTVTACDALADVSQPIAIGNVLGIGRDATGTLYVVDDAPNVFVSEGGAMQRHLVSGSGESAGAILLTTNDTNPSTSFTLKLERANSVTTRMGIVHGPVATKDFDIGTQGEVLTLQDPSAISGLPVKNLPGTTSILDDAVTPDGRRMIVTSTFEQPNVRLFFGTAPLLTERVVSLYSSNAITFITFNLDGVTANVVLPTIFSDQNTKPTLTTDHPMPLIVNPAGTSVSGLQFECFVATH